MLGIAVLAACGGEDAPATSLRQGGSVVPPDLQGAVGDGVGPVDTADDTSVFDGSEVEPPDLVGDATPEDLSHQDGVPGDVPVDTAPTDGGTGADATPQPCELDSDCETNPRCGEGRCEGGLCRIEAFGDGEDCDDGDPCTTGDRCFEGRCIGFGTLTCEGSDACQQGSCVRGQGCVFEPLDCGQTSTCFARGCDPASGCFETPVGCPASTDPCLESRCDETLGCGLFPRLEGASCDDGDPCTLGGVCRSGRCVETEDACDDGDPCTNDTCTASGQCVHTPNPSCAEDPACVGVAPGGSCDDGQALTSGDMCIQGRCRGFLTRRISGSVVAGFQGLVVREVAHGPQGWDASFWSARIGEDGLAWSLATITDPDAPILHAGTTSAEAYTDLGDAHALRGDGVIMAATSAGWSTSSPFNPPIDAAGMAGVTSLYTRRDRGPGGSQGARRMWVGGFLGGEGLVLACVEGSSGVSCAPQALDVPWDAPVPLVIAGLPRCTANGACTGAWLGLGADALGGGGTRFTDTFANATGAGDWEAGFVTEAPAARSTRGIAAWGTASAPRMLVVGGGSYLNYMSAANIWSGPLAAGSSRGPRTFTGAAVVGDTVLVSAFALTNAEVLYELWAAPANSNLASGTSWRIHEVARGPRAEAAGLYGVAAGPQGEVMAVGGIERQLVSGPVRWLDGLVLWRLPD